MTNTLSAPTFDTVDADFDDQINTNLRAPYILVQKLVPGMIERGGGVVVNVTTVAATSPASGAGIYGASKAALELLTKLWATSSAARVCGSTPSPLDLLRRRALQGSSQTSSRVSAARPRWCAQPRPTRSRTS